MDFVDGKPVRNKTICESILSKHDEIAKEFVQKCVERDIPEALAKEIAEEMKLYHRQYLLGVNSDERPAFFPKDKWEQKVKHG